MTVNLRPCLPASHGTCELMLACMAKAQSYTIMVNTEEMEDVQWYDKAELREAVRLYDTAPDRPLNVLQQVRACKGGMRFLFFHTVCSCMVAEEGWHQPCASLHALSSNDDS